MFGHGRPSSGAITASRNAALGRIAVALAMALLFVDMRVVRADDHLASQPVRLRIMWGGKSPDRWTGGISLDGGTLAEMQLLGMDADAAASIWSDGRQIHVESLSPHLYDGVDMTVTPTSTSRLLITLKNGPDATPVQAEVPLSKVLSEPLHLPLDTHGNEISVERAPGDSLRITPTRPQLIFAPGEELRLDVQPVLDGIQPSTTIDIEATLTAARNPKELWTHEQRLPVPVNGPAIATLHVPLPMQEGVYQMRIVVNRPPGFRARFFPGGSAAPLVERTFQAVVLESSPTTPASDARWQPVLEIDPANPRWWERLPDWTQIRRIPGISRRPLGSHVTVTIKHPLGNFVELPKTPENSEPHWQAYPLPLESVGVPHMLEIEYPDDQEQHVGISIVEPNAAGKVVSIGRDSGVYVEGLGHTERGEKRVQRVIFWPRTNSPQLLVTNEHPMSAARFGHIRVFRRSANTIATEPWPKSATSGRLVAAYLSRPLLPETFGATEGIDVAGGYSIDDWQSAYESATRLAEYLNYAGYNSAAVSVLADGGSTFASSHIASIPLHNSARLAEATTDLPATDPLELLLRVFDRTGMSLVPTLQFAAPLPELEALRRGGESARVGIELVGPTGQTWLEAHEPDHGLAPYYNLLDDRVQQAMLNVVRDLLDNYGKHPALAGVAVQLGGSGYSLLVDPEWGLDDATIAQFQRDTGVKLADGWPNRFASRRASLLGENADAWRDWRAARVTRFYQSLANLVESSGSRRQLILTTEDLASMPVFAARFRPNVVSKPRVDRAMLEVGLDRDALEAIPGLLLCSTRYVESMAPLVDRAVDLEINNSFADSQKQSRRPASAAMLYHRPQAGRLASFDAKSPFESHLQLLRQSSADGARARQELAEMFEGDDPQIVLDGGEMLPLGQEDAKRQALRVLQQLPRAAATSVTHEQSVTVRTYDAAEGTVFVVANECPWQSEAKIGLRVPRATLATSLVGETNVAEPTVPPAFDPGVQIWTVSLAPYEVRGVKFSAPSVSLDKIQCTLSEPGQRELAARVSDLRDRDLTSSKPYAVLKNASFEPIGGAEPVPGWKLNAAANLARVSLDATAPQDGKTCVYLEHFKSPGKVTLESHTFPTPPTGQLVMAVYVRGENIDPTTQLHLGFEVDGGAAPSRRFATLGGNGPAAQAIDSEWKYWAFRSEDLPLDSRGRMRVVFELTGPGEVWFDNVQLNDLLFPLAYYEHSQQEKLKLLQMIHAANKAQQSGDITDCVQMLEGYWPRFLTAYTPAVPPAVATQPPAAPPTPPPTAKPDENNPSMSDRMFKTWPSIWKK